MNLNDKIDLLHSERKAKYIAIVEFLDNIKMENPNLSYQEVANHLLIILKDNSYRLTCSNNENYHNPYFYDDWISENGIATYVFDDVLNLNCIAEKSNPDFLFIVLEFIRDNYTVESSSVGMALNYIPLKYKNLFLDRIKLADILPTQDTRKSKETTEKEIKGKSETSYLNLILALREICLSNNQFKNQEALINHIVTIYQGYVGMSESNVRDKFSKANKFK